MARASWGKLVGIDEKATIRITRVQRQHPVVDILLGTFGMVTRSQEPASRIWSLAGFQTSRLGVVVVTIGVVFGDVLEDNAPVAFNIDGPLDLGVSHSGGAEVAFGSNPVSSVIGRGTLWGSGVVIVVEGSFLRSNDVLDQVISWLVSHVGVLFQENGVLRDLVSDIVLGIFGILETIRKVRMKGTGRRGFGITIPMRGGGIGGRVVGRMMGRGGVVRRMMDRGRMGMGGIGHSHC
jgi:hypothetical protein